jgi:hypothetical protein
MSCRRLRAGCAIAASAVLLAVWCGAAVAAGQAGPKVNFGNGSLVLFKGSKLQCLGFGPYGVPGKSGVVCFRGSPKHIYTHSYAAAIYALEPGAKASVAHIWPNNEKDLRRIFDATTIGKTYQVALNGTAELAGTSITCFYYVSDHLDRGHRGVACYPTDSQGPLPGKNGIFLDDVKAALVDVDSSRSVKLNIEVNQKTGDVTSH